MLEYEFAEMSDRLLKHFNATVDSVSWQCTYKISECVLWEQDTALAKAMQETRENVISCIEREFERTNLLEENLEVAEDLEQATHAFSENADKVCKAV